MEERFALNVSFPVFLWNAMVIKNISKNGINQSYKWMKKRYVSIKPEQVSSIVLINRNDYNSPVEQIFSDNSMSQS